MVGDEAESSRLLILVWSPSDHPSPRSPPRVPSLEQKMLLSARNPQEFSNIYARGCWPSENEKIWRILCQEPWQRPIYIFPVISQGVRPERFKAAIPNKSKQIPSWDPGGLVLGQEWVQIRIQILWFPVQGTYLQSHPASCPFGSWSNRTQDTWCG